MPVLSTRIVLDCFYLLIFYSEKFSTDVCRLPYAVNVNLNLSILLCLSPVPHCISKVSNINRLLKIIVAKTSSHFLSQLVCHGLITVLVLFMNQ